MAKKKVEIAPEEEAALDSVSFDGIESGDTALPIMSSVAEMEEDPTIEKVHPRFGPPMWSENWQDFVLSQFKDDEKDDDGNPYVHGLRRVARKLLGPIVHSGPLEASPAEFLGTPRETDLYSLLKPVTVRYVLRILWTRPEDIPDGGEAFMVEYTDVADCMRNNTDPEFLIHPSAMASTRAEGRCLRKALQIKKVSAEEKTRVPLVEASATGLIRESDIIFIEALCRRLDINLMNYVNAGSKKYDSIEQVALGTAERMTEHLSMLQNQKDKIKPEWKGYDPNWRDNTF